MTYNELCHHGIRGMKWGVRRYQNRDGTLTEAGKKHYGSDSDNDEKKDPLNRKANVRKLSNEEVDQYISRLKKEKELKALLKEDLNPGKKFIQEILSDSSKRALTVATTGAMLYGAKSLASKEFSGKDFGKAMFNGGPEKKK